MNYVFSHLENLLSVGFHPAHQKLSASQMLVAVSCQGIWKVDVCILDVLFFKLRKLLLENCEPLLQASLHLELQNS